MSSSRMRKVFRPQDSSVVPRNEQKHFPFELSRAKGHEQNPLYTDSKKLGGNYRNGRVESSEESLSFETIMIAFGGKVRPFHHRQRQRTGEKMLSHLHVKNLSFRPQSEDNLRKKF